MIQIDAILPVTKADLPRAKILFYSLERHLKGLRRLFVVCPDADLDLFRSEMPDSLPIELIGELDLLPDLRHYQRLRKLKPKALISLAVHRLFRGWGVQQIIKLAIAERVQTPYYLTLDADVIAARPMVAEEFFHEGKAICQRGQNAGLHASWYRGNQLYFGLPESASRFGVTPNVLSKEGVEHLIRFINSNARRSIWRRLSPVFRPKSWKGVLTQIPTWTEYSLYFAALEHLGQLDRLHHPVEQNRYYLDSVMGPEAWIPFRDRYLTSKEVPRSPFIIVQSTIGVPDQELWRVLRPRCFPDGPAECPD